MLKRNAYKIQSVTGNLLVYYSGPNTSLVWEMNKNDEYNNNSSVIEDNENEANIHLD